MEQYNWQSVKELFEKLNADCNYLILRNFECMKDDNIFTEGHEDIDILCEDARQIVKLMDARPRRSYDNKVQYYILLQGQKVKIDLRHVGDKYYDPVWQAKMLENRQFHELGFYVMKEEDYFYSLIYHSVLQKKALSEDYRARLEKMAEQNGVSGKDEKSFLALLEAFMSENDYYYWYPEDSTIPNRFGLVSADRRKGYAAWCIHKGKHLPVRAVSFLKHKVGG